MLTVKCNGELYHCLDAEQLRNSLVLAEVSPDIVDNSTLRLVIDVVFNGVIVRSAIGRPASFYVGTGGARITLRVSEGELIEPFTEAVVIDVKYENSVDLTQRETVSFKSAAAGEITVEAGRVRRSKSEFVARERTLSPMFLPPTTITWDIDSPHGERVVSDFIFGNLYLVAHVKHSRHRIEGGLDVVPQEMAFYDSSKRRIGGSLRNALMIARMMVNVGRAKVRAAHGVFAEFEITRG
ncbi:MAG: hypothetical protein U0Q11_11715 [Vicinamibacterales bacterium]